jgi:hydroxymethylbilane synthase
VNYRPLRLGTRRSPMAIAQSRQVAGMITTRTGMAVEIVGVTTMGDVSRSQLVQLGGTGVFVSALREALLAGEVDLAVHSAKDLPAGAAGTVALAGRGTPSRHDTVRLADLPSFRAVFVTNSLGPGLPGG